MEILGRYRKILDKVDVEYELISKIGMLPIGLKHETSPIDLFCDDGLLKFGMMSNSTNFKTDLKIVLDHFRQLGKLNYALIYTYPSENVNYSHMVYRIEIKMKNEVVITILLRIWFKSMEDLPLKKTCKIVKTDTLSSTFNVECKIE